MNVEILGDFLDGFDALDRFKRHAGLEFGVVSSAFAFHVVCVWYGLKSAPTHHNHSLTTGPIFGVQLIILGCIFTVLVAIIFILSFAGFAASNAAIQKTRKTNCLATAISIESAVTNFYVEYGSMPKDGNSDATVATNADTAILKELLGLSTTLNTRGVKFLSAKKGKDGKNGLIYGADGSSTLGLYDPWGGGYRIRMDLDYDDELDVNGEVLSDRKVAVWSDGPDRKAGTKDDIKTW